MPTVLQTNGWRLYFYANEGSEPMQVHADKAEMKCKFWLHADRYEVELAWARNLGPPDLRQVHKLIYLNFEQIEAAWHDCIRRKSR
jgi:hypothetical protein